MSFFHDFFISVRLVRKARFAWIASAIFFAVVAVIFFSAYFSGRQPATVSLDVGFSSIRLLLPFYMVLLVQELLSSEFEGRYYFGSLAYPRARSCFLYGRFGAILAFVLSFLLLLSLAQFFLVSYIEGFYPQATPVSLGKEYWVVIFFVAIDLLVLTALSVFLAVVASKSNFVLVGAFGFMFVSRSYGLIVELLAGDAGLVGSPETYRAGLGFLGYFLPDLGALDVRVISLYGKMELLAADWHWTLISALAYAVGLLALAIYAFQRKRFI